MKKKTTKHALVLSILSIVLSCTMFVGSTYAWFTDSVVSKNNKIAAGTLTVDLELYNKETGQYETIADKEGAIFKKDGNGINWEPGKTEIVYFRVKNNGNLNLKYDFLFSVVNGGLIGALEYAIVDGATHERAFTSWDNVKANTTQDNIKRLQEGRYAVYQNQLLAPYGDANGKDMKYFALAIHMDDAAPNEYQAKTVTIDASVFATQATAEDDSFNNSYDANATYDYVVADATKDFATVWGETKEGSIIYLDEDITISGLNVDKNMTIDAAGHNINITGVSRSTVNGVQMQADKTLVIRNAKMSTLPISGAGTIVLHGTTITAQTAGTSAVTLNASTTKLVVKGYTVLTGATNGSGIYVSADSSLDLSGSGKLVVIGNAGQETDANTGGSGIAGNGTIYIHDLANLTAEGNGTAGFGIGGESSDITIKKTNIAYVKGGYVQPNFINDTKYGKSEPEGGAAIGSMTNGAVITLEEVILDKAEGGSKSAAIGARYHTAVTVNIKNSTLKEVIGGNASAGIGGSRIRQDNAKEQTVDITIIDSIVNAIGGQGGAGIGSGYDTHCSAESPICTINIKGTSKITAQGGKYAAGIGTGFHAGGLAGAIENTVDVTAASGEEFYKDAYTKAQNIGFGVVDPAREGQTAQNCEFDNKGTIIKVVFPVVNQ